MKNYPNQASSFARVRGTLRTISHLLDNGSHPGNNFILGYQAARHRVYTFRGLSDPNTTADQIESKIAEEVQKPSGSQGAQTFARELRRTLRDMGWIDTQSEITNRGKELLGTDEGSLEEQALLVEGLLRIVATYKGDTTAHHPVRTMLQLLAKQPSRQRVGLELALEPLDDSEQELGRVLRLYDLSIEERTERLGISPHQRANAVKIFPPLALYAGLVSIDDQKVYSLTLEGWQAIGKKPMEAGRAIIRHRGRRTSVGRLVTPSTIASGRNKRSVPRLLSPEEQKMAAGKLTERTASHQLLVERMAANVPEGKGELFEDDFSYDMLWVPKDTSLPIFLFEMKTVTGELDAYSRGRDALGQLRYYAYFNVSPLSEGRDIVSCFVADDVIPEALSRFFAHENVGVIIARPGEQSFSANYPGEKILEMLQGS